MNNYEIEQNVALPKGKDSFYYKYPFRKMQVGDSFSVLETEVTTVRGSAYAFASRNKVKLSIRKTKDGYRCWRLK